MAEVTQIPGRLDIQLAQGDDMSILLDFDIDLTGYTFESKVVEADETETVITVVETDLSNGQITLTLSDTLSALISVATHSWFLDRTNAGSQRRQLAGDFEVIKFK